MDKAGGYSALNYVIEASAKRFILKVYRSANEAYIKKIEDITLFLHSNSLPVIVPVRDRNNSYYFILDGKIFALYPLASGDILHQQTLLDKSLESVAVLIANFHELGANCTLNLRKTSELIPSVQAISEKAKMVYELINKNSLGSSIDELAIKLISVKQEILKSLIETNSFKEFMPQHDLVHGDFHNENMLFDGNKKLAYLLDFEEVHFGHGMEDVINFIQFACCNTGYEKENLAKARCFFKAYSSLRPVTNKEIVFGIHYNLLKMASSFFLEEELYVKKDMFLAKLLQRDFEKISYFQKNIQLFIDNLSK